jgi:predicted dehydrogenase
MKKIVLIGAGQLGRRHLQSLSKINFAAEIEVVDTVPASLAAAKAQFDEMPVNGNIRGISYLSSISDLSKHVDVAIIATNADARAAVVRSLLEACEVKGLMLEKVLFQKPEDYLEIQELFESKGIKVWVNHPRRLFPIYNKMKSWIAGSTRVSYQVQGGAWGLACNGLHFLDHLAYLSGETTLTISAEGLNPSVIQSKREGFVEFSGVLHGKIGSNPFSIFCHDEFSPVVITICTDNLNVMIDESNGWYRIARKDNHWKWETVTDKIVHFQSELSHKVVEDILVSGQCDLPTYADAVKLHLPFIRCLMNHLEKIEQREYNICPIT